MEMLRSEASAFWTYSPSRACVTSESITSKADYLYHISSGGVRSGKDSRCEMGIRAGKPAGDGWVGHIHRTSTSTSTDLSLEHTE
eukprot:scaffold83575_cov20-Prasinocladus_malaysianus.AAC.2